MRKIYWTNPYWMGYNKIEKRIIELSHSISFDDQQMYVYSNEIADLLLSTVSKIESIAKDFYEAKIYPYNVDKNNTEYSDEYFHQEKANQKIRTDWRYKNCLSHINKKINLKDKGINLNDNIFKFIKHNKEIKPFGMFDDSKSKIGGTISRKTDKNKDEIINVDWTEAYNDLKHNYIDSIPKYGNILQVVFALSSLYLLIIYYEFTDAFRYIYSLDELESNFEESFGSELFSVIVHNKTELEFFKSPKKAMINRIAGEDINKSTLLMIQHPNVYSQMQMKINEFKVKNPDVSQIDTDKFYFSSFDNNSDEYKLFSQVYHLDGKYVSSRQIILNEGKSEKEIWVYNQQNGIVEYDKKFINKTKSFLSTLKVGDKVELYTLSNEYIKGEVLKYDISENMMTLKTETSNSYSFPKTNVKRIRNVKLDTP